MPTDLSAGSGSALSEVERADRRSQRAALCLTLLTAASIWLSTGILLSGDTDRIAALPPIWFLVVLAVAAVAVARSTRLRLDKAWPLVLSLLLWLPYLPIPVPSPFLIWEGPIEVIVWMVIAGGLIAGWQGRVPAVFRAPALAPWLAATGVAIAALIAFGQVRNVVPGGDEPHYLAATQSLLRDLDLKVANNYESGDYLDYFPGRLEPHFLKRSTSGEIYSIHAPGVSLTVLPAFAIAGYLGAVLTMVAVAALSALLAWRLAYAVSGSAEAAWAGMAGVFFSAPYFFHTFTIYPEAVGSFCVLAGMWLLIELQNERDPSPRLLLAIGAALAWLPWLHSRFAVLAGIIGGLVLVRLLTRPSAPKRIATFLAVPVVAGAAWFTFFYVIWGTPSPMAPYGADSSTSAAYVLRGLIGLLFDQQFGVLTTAPVYVVAIAGGALLCRSQPRLAFELGLIVVPYAITVASYAMWWAGAAAPARFLVAILPLAAVPVAVAWSRSIILRSIALVLVVVSAALLWPRVLEDSGRFIYNNRSAIDATVRWLSSSADLPAALPSVHRSGGWIALRSGAVWLLGFVVALTVIRSRTRRIQAAARFTITAWALAIAVMLCGRVVWAFGEAPPIDQQHSKLSALDRFRPSWQSTIVRLPLPTLTTVDAFLQGMPVTVQGTRIAVDNVPAGEYLVAGAPSNLLAGSVAIAVGRNDGPIAEPTLDDLRNSHTPFRLRLPVAVRTLNFRVNADRNPAELTLRPVGVVKSLSRRAATRAARFGHTRAFFFDEWLYPERDGFWTRANGSASVVITTDEGTRLSGLPIAITAGAVPTTVTVSTGSWEESFALAAGQRQDVMLPPADAGAWPLRIRSGAGFRPSEREPGNRDVRELAAWIAIY